jgi:hypothetical protein
MVTMVNTTPMHDYEHQVLRHIVAKAAAESDIDFSKFDVDEIETALWSASASISFGDYPTHPDKHDFDYHHD